MIHIAVSILNFNSSEATIACVRSLLNSKSATDPGCELSIYVADNHSEESQQKLLFNLAGHPEVNLRQHEKNVGFSAGHNLNIEAIFKQGAPDFIWVLNNDSAVASTALSALMAAATNHQDVAVWGATILDESGNTVQNAGGCIYNSWLSTYKELGNRLPLSELKSLKNRDFDYLSGASLFFPARAVQTGFESLESISSKHSRPALFNEDFFLYFEELDLAKRLKPEYKMAWCKEAVIHHAGGASTGTHSGQSSRLAEYHSSLSALKFTRLYYPQRLWIMAPARYLLKCLQLIVKGKFRLVKHLNRAYYDFWVSKPNQ